MSPSRKRVYRHHFAMWDKKRAIAFGRKAGGKMRKDSTVGECCDGSLSHPLTTPIVSCNGEKQPSPD